MTPPPLRPSWLRLSRAWSLLCAAWGVASVLVWLGGLPAMGADPSHHPLAWQADQWIGRPWTIWTASFVHVTGGHLLMNIVILAVLAQLGIAVGATRLVCLAALVAWPVGTELLALWPTVPNFAGLSGLVHTAAAVLWTWCALEQRATPIPHVLGLVLALKLAAEHAWAQPVAFDPAWGFNVVVAAHLTHALAGVGSAALLWGVARLRTTPWRTASAGAQAARMRASSEVVE